MSERTGPRARALISVSDKTGVAELASALHELGIAILSTGGTYGVIAKAGVPVMEVAEYTGFPELMDGRVKTLHPKIHGGILARRGIDDRALEEHAIEPIDVVVVNLYPFAATIARADCTEQLALENIDIGGPAMLRAAAKNHQEVLVVIDPGDYGVVVAALRSGGASAGLRRKRRSVIPRSMTALWPATWLVESFCRNAWGLATSSGRICATGRIRIRAPLST